jgi:hypothetical protein
MSSYQFARIDLSKTDYSIDMEWMYMRQPNIPALNAIYREYCALTKSFQVSDAYI